jgi:hypothetical protein
MRFVCQIRVSIADIKFLTKKYVLF